MDVFANKRLLQVKTSNRMKYWGVKKNATVFKEHYAFTRMQAPVGILTVCLFDLVVFGHSFALYSFDLNPKVHFSAVHLVLLFELG